ncbi:MerR family transcriptional regulator [Cohnella zeiphila]|uniref:MerR family transcriptional regulator n=1 Tax=Cohnella zeiphila TaxID=2761120 RepID=A0A7X0SPH6_9BACL|nr:MerR family transcriptional regulator [Cohnella zeiphila]MBB6733699.1 MerR family transcriptional regulator [Cohnella zeiphila]
MKIHALAQRTGLTAPTIRFYEQEGLLDERHVRRSENNYRDYSEATVEHLLTVKKIQAVGFTLAELKQVIREDEASGLPLSRVVELLRLKLEEIERKKQELEQVGAHLTLMLAKKSALLEAEQRGKTAVPYRIFT